jgi:AAHS family 4-hydroxybenzoate transporter-like MFS transporter
MAATSDAASAALMRTQIKVAVLCCLIQTLDGYDLVTIGLAVPSLTKAWSLPPTAFTQAFVFSSIGIMVGALLSGPIADRVGRKPTLLTAIAFFGLGSLLSAYASSLSTLVVLRFITGVGIGGAMPTTVGLTSDYTSDRWRASVVMFMFTGASIGGFFAGQVAAFVLPRWGWPGIFLVGGIAPLVLLVVSIFILPESPQFQGGARPASLKANPVGGLFEEGRAFTTVVVWAIFLLNLLNLFLVNYWMPTVLHLRGLSPSEAAFVTSMFSAGGVLVTLLLGPGMIRFGAERVLTICLLAGAVCFALTALDLSRLAITAVVFGAGAGVVGSQLGLNGYVASIYPASVRSTGIGWALGIGRLGGIIGPALGGALLGVGIPADEVMLFACGPAVITALLVAVLGLRRRGAQPA